MDEKNKNEYVVPGRLTMEDLHKQHDELVEAKKVSESKPKPSVLNAMSMITVGLDFALMIALPLIGFIFLGKWLDAKNDSKYFVLIGILLAIAVSSIGIYKQVKKLKRHIK